MRIAVRLAAALAALTAIAGVAAAQPAIDESLLVPFVTEVGQSAFKQYRLAPAPKAFLVSASGIAVWRQEETLELSLQRAGEVCARIARLPCRAYAENDAVVWDGPVTIAAQQEFARGHNVAAHLSGARFAQESTDRKVAPVADPARAPVHGATPTALPGGAVITTGALRTALHGEASPLLIDVSSSRGERIGTIPGAIWLDKAGLGRWRAGDDAAEARAFRAAMARIAPNLETPLVFTCDSANCWQAYRAALRAISLGHTDVAWYRGGVLSWVTAGLALAQAPLFESVYDPAQENALVERQIAALRAAAAPARLRPPAEIKRWRAYLVAAHDREPVFHRAIDRIAALLATSGVQRPDIAWLSAATREPTRLPTRANVEAMFAPRQPARGDGCFVYLTSHGDDRGIELVVERETWQLAPAELGRLLDRSCGSAPTVVVVSACYSGVYVDPAVLAPNRILLTAARRDRASFGCSIDFEFSFFDGCFVENFRGAAGWAQLAEAVIGCVRDRETVNRMEPRSLPTATIGAQARGIAMIGAKPPVRRATPRPAQVEPAAGPVRTQRNGEG
jgi:rhodanese-related sulfurtransferase